MNGMVAITLVMKDARFVISRHLTDYNSLCNLLDISVELTDGAANNLRAITAEMRARKVNHGKSTSPTLIAWADRIDAELARLGL